MAGVLFLIWIPCAKREEILTDKNIWETTTELKEQTQNPQSSDEEIESQDQKNSQSTTESDVANQDVEIKEQPTNADDKSTADTGSIDSDTLRRLEKERKRIRENEAAIDKFFSLNTNPAALDETSSMEVVLREIIEKFRIKNSSWVRMNNGNSYQITFSLEKGVRCDDTIHMLSEWGIGQKPGSSVAIIPCTLYSEVQAKDDEATSTSSQMAFKETAWNRFIGTVRARMNVAKIVVECKESATLTFDFIVLLIVASILACFGLVENSTLFLAASMLISPLMGPILAATFGAVIKDHKLQYWGLKNEIIGIFMCIFVGFVFGIITCGLNYIFDSQKDITSEMITRTDFHSVIVGIFIALPSGAAVAIAVIGENFGSLVGVAISASLLPPAVNTGLLWSYSCVHKLFKEHNKKFESFGVDKKYTDDVGLELLTLGVISLCMTLTNVLCVYLMGFVFLKVKEVAPVSDDQRQFWKHDIKIARDYNKTIYADEGRKLQEELNQFQENTCDNFKGVGAELLRQSYSHINTWSPLTMRHHFKDSHGDRMSIRDHHDSIYTRISDKNAAGDKSHRHFPHTKSASPHNENRYTTPKRSNVPASPKRIAHDSTLVSIEGPGPSGTKRFIVTPSDDQLV